MESHTATMTGSRPEGNRRAGTTDAASRSTRGFWAVAAAFLVVMAGTTLPSPLFALYEQKLGIAPLDVTVLYAVYGVGVVAALASVSRFGGRISPRARLATGLGLSALSAGVFLATDNVALLVVARVLSGLAAGVTTGAATVSMIDLGGRGRRAWSAATAVGTSFGGLAFGTILAGALSATPYEPLKIPFLVHLALLAAVSPALLSMPQRATKSAAVVGKPGTADEARHNARRVFQGSALLAACGFVANAIIPAIGASFLAGSLGLTNRAVAGVFIAIVFVATAVGQLAVRRLPRRVAAPSGAASLIAGLAALVVMCVVPSAALFLVGSVLIGVGTGISTAAGLVAITAASPQAQTTKAVARYYMVVYASMAVPITVLGVVVQAIGVLPATGGLCVIVLAVAAGALLRFRAVLAT